MDTREVVCPNPECQKKMREPILLTTQTEHYYACPRCFTELNVHTCPPEEHMDTTIKEYLQDSVSGGAKAVRMRDPLDALAPNRRFRRP